MDLDSPGRVEAFRPEGRGFESRSSCHVGTLGKYLSRSCLSEWSFEIIVTSTKIIVTSICTYVQLWLANGNPERI